MMFKQVETIEGPFGPVRMVEDNGETLYGGTDIAWGIGYRNPSSRVAEHCKGPRRLYAIKTRTSAQKVRFLTKQEAIELINCSIRPAAEEYGKWFTETVLSKPCDKKTPEPEPASSDGCLDDLDPLIKLAETLKKERAQRTELETKLQTAVETLTALIADTKGETND